MKIANAEQYQKRYAKRGEKARTAKRRSFADSLEARNMNFREDQGLEPYRYGHRFHMDYENRFVNIENCWPLFEHHGKKKLATYK